MEIHDLNTKALTDPAYVAFDDGTDTYKVEFNDTVESAAQSAVAAADLTQNTVGFTSGDSLSPSGWTDVSQITTNSTLATLFNRISTMVKNVRYIWNLLGSSSFSNVASTLTGAIGNTALTTTAQTLSGAIAEHESDISTLNGKTRVEFTTQAGANYSPYGGCYYEVWNRLVHIHVGISGLTANTGNQVFTIPTELRPTATIFTVGGSGSADKYAIIESRGSGGVVVYPMGTYCGADIFYLI